VAHTRETGKQCEIWGSISLFIYFNQTPRGFPGDFTLWTLCPERWRPIRSIARKYARVKWCAGQITRYTVVARICFTFFIIKIHTFFLLRIKVYYP